MKEARNDAKKTFRKKGACSHTFFFLLNREFGHLRPDEERAANPLAGGINRAGYQCGMLWGASLAAGAEAYRTQADTDQAIRSAIGTTQRLMESFADRTGSVDCEDITDTNFSSKMSFAKYMLSGRFLYCFRLAEEWMPEAIQTAREGLAAETESSSEPVLSCATEVARRMGATDEQAVMVAGFAGGLGLSGNACGALSAAIWMNALAWGRAHPGNAMYPLAEGEKTIEAMYETTDYEILCEKICARKFSSVEEHAEYVRNGGCSALIEKLAQGESLVQN